MLNTIYPEYLTHIIDHAVEIRNKPEANEEKKEFILISDDWYEQLMSHPFISSKHSMSTNKNYREAWFYCTSIEVERQNV